MHAAALLALLATAAADRPLVVATRPADATSSLPVLPTAGRARVAAYSGSTAAQRRTEVWQQMKKPFLKGRRHDQKLALRHVRDTSRAVREAARAVNGAKRQLAEARRYSSEARGAADPTYAQPKGAASSNPEPNQGEALAQA